MKDLISLIQSDMGLLIHILVIAAITFLVNLVFNRTINRSIKKNIHKDDFDPTSLKFLQRGVSLLIYIIGFALIIYNIPSLDHREALGKDQKSDVSPVRVMKVGDSSITLRAWSWAKDPSDAFVMGCELRESIKARFEQENIEIPYPYQNIVVTKNNQDGV